MTGRRLRESPRMVAASVLVGVLLILIGILAASTTAGGTAHTPAPAKPAAAVTPAPAAAPSQASAQQAAALRSDQATIAQLRASLRSQGAQLSGAAAREHSAQANARCWHQKLIHPIKTRTMHCAPPA